MRKTDIPLLPIVEQWQPQWECYHPGLARVLPTVKQFVNAVMMRQPPKRWLTLLGASGIGKTFILKQAFEFLEEHMRVKRGSGTGFAQCAHIIPARDLTDWQSPRDYGAYDLIYVEDIGSGSDDSVGSGRVTRSRVTELMQLRSGKWTMADANLSVADIEARLDGRIASRLKRDGSWLLDIPSEVPDYWFRKEVEVEV